MANTGIQHWAKVAGGPPRCRARAAIMSGPVLEEGAHWCRKCRPGKAVSLTEADWRRVEVALRLRAESAEESGDLEEAAAWRATLAKVASKPSVGQGLDKSI